MLIGEQPSAKALEAKVYSFLETHALFQKDVSLVEPGCFVIRGRRLSDLSEMDGVVRVDGYQRPLHDALEELCHEAVLDRRSRSNAVLRQLLSAILEEQERKLSSIMVERCFHALRWGSRRRRYAAALEMSQQLRVRHVFMICWLFSTWARWAKRAAHHRPQFLDHLLSGCRAAPRLQVHSMLLAWALHIFNKHAHLRLSLAIWFSAWSREVQVEKRRKLDNLVAGEAMLVKQEMDYLRIQTNAWQTLHRGGGSCHGEGAAANVHEDAVYPGSKMVRLSCAVGDMLEKMSPKVHSPIAMKAVLRAAAKEKSVDQRGDHWNETVKAFQAMSQARTTMEKMWADSVYLLLLRCFSTWLRTVQDKHVERATKALLDPADAARRERAASLMKVDSIVSQQRFMVEAARQVFDAWAVLMKARQQANRLFEERMGIEESRQKEAAFNMLQLLKQGQSSCSRASLGKIVTMWRICGLQQKVVRLQKNLIASDKAHEVAGSKHTRSTAATIFSSAFALWASLSGRRRHQRALAHRQQRTVRQCLLSTCFFVLKSLVRGRAFQRSSSAIAVAAIGFVQSHSMFVYHSLVFTGWCRELQRSKESSFQDRSQVSAKRLRSHCFRKADVALQCHGTVVATTTLRSIMLRWCSAAQRERRVAEQHERAVTSRTAESAVRLARSRMRLWQIRASSRHSDTMVLALLHLVWIVWCCRVGEETHERTRARDWLRRQRFQDIASQGFAAELHTKLRLKALAEKVVKAHVFVRMPAVFFSWWRWERSLRLSRTIAELSGRCAARLNRMLVIRGWRMAIICAEIRSAGGQVGRAMAFGIEISMATRTLMAWHEVAWTEKSFARQRRLTKLLVVMPKLNVVQRSALRRWKTQALKIRRAEAHRRVQRLIGNFLAKDLHLALSRVFLAWAAVWRRTSLDKQRDVHLAREAIALWRAMASEGCHQRRQARAYGASARHGEYAGEVHSDVLVKATRALHLKYLHAAGFFLGRRVPVLDRRWLLSWAWLVFVDLLRDADARDLLRTRRIRFLTAFANQSGVFIKDILTVIYFRFWVLHYLNEVHLIHTQQRQVFAKQADGLTERLFGINSRTFGLLTASSAFMAWRASIWKCGHRRLCRMYDRYQAARLRAAAQRRLWSSFRGWLRLSRGQVQPAQFFQAASATSMARTRFISGSSPTAAASRARSPDLLSRAMDRTATSAVRQAMQRQRFLSP